MCQVKCQDCALWDDDKICKYCDHFEYYRGANRCRIDDEIVTENYYCSYFKLNGYSNYFEYYRGVNRRRIYNEIEREDQE